MYEEQQDVRQNISDIKGDMNIHCLRVILCLGRTCSKMPGNACNIVRTGLSRMERN